MSQNKEDIKNKIIYRSSYRGTKEMDILMTSFVKSIINELDYNQLIQLDKFINLDDEILKSLKNKELKHQINEELIFILKKFEKF
jgi:antitoxin CptB